jgi:hypothetical protein
MKICNVWKIYFYETKTDRSEDNNNNVIVEMKEDNLENDNKISEDLFLKRFFKSFTTLKVEECFEKIRLEKNYRKTA